VLFIFVVVVNLEEKKRTKKESFLTFVVVGGRFNGVATILGFKLHGFAVWWLWQTYYLGNLPTI
jgi:NADH dehydrogenase FAD-containing subunit